MHTLIFSFPYESAMGGGERYTEQMIEGLLEKGHQFTLVSSSWTLIDMFTEHKWERFPIWGGIEPVTKLTVLLFFITWPLFLPIILATLIYFRIKRKSRNMICLSLTEKLLATIPARLLGMKVIWMEHLMPGRSLLLNPYRRLFVALSRFAKVVTVSKPALMSFTKIGIPKRRLEIISPGTRTEEKDTHTGKPVIGCVSRLHPEKNVGYLIRAFSKIVKEIPEAELHIYGNGPEQKKLESLCNTLNIVENVTFFGWVDSRTGIYKNFKVFCAPSLKESFGIATLEAMSHGIPIVATRVGGLNDLVSDGVSGTLVELGEVNKLKDALMEFLSDHEKAVKFGLAGKYRASNLFSEKKMLSEWNILLKENG